MCNPLENIELNYFSILEYPDQKGDVHLRPLVGGQQNASLRPPHEDQLQVDVIDLTRHLLDEA